MRSSTFALSDESLMSNSVAMNYWSEEDDESSFAKKYRLETEIRATKQGDRTIQQLYNVMASYWDQLSEVEPSDLIKLSSYKKYAEERRLVQFLMALNDEFEALRKSILQRPILPTVERAVNELKIEENKIKSSIVCFKGKQTVEDMDSPLSKFLSLSINRRDSEDEAGLSGGLSGDVAKIVDASFAVARVSRALYNYFGNTEDSGKNSTSLKILTYNVWFREDVELHERMEALGELICLHSPDVICFQEVTQNIYRIFKQSSWWKAYNCLEVAHGMSYFCLQLSKLTVQSSSRIQFRNSTMGRDLSIARIEVSSGKTMTVATSHLESPCPAPPRYDQMYSKERVAQAKEALNILKSCKNVIFCGDMNWDDEKDDCFPLLPGWVDAWTELMPRENGWTFDTKSNPMLSGNYPLQKRIDRFVCNLSDFKLSAIQMIGKEAIPGVYYFKEKKVRNRIQTLKLPVLPSDHYGLVLEISAQNGL